MPFDGPARKHYFSEEQVEEYRCVCIRALRVAACFHVREKAICSPHLATLCAQRGV